MVAEFCGLVFPHKPRQLLPVPLKSVTVHADVRGWTVGVTAELAYQNTLAEPIECQFVFPLSDKSAVYRLEADVAGKKLYAECRPREEAEEMYKDAVDSGHTGVLLENQSGSPDVFRIMLGNLLANQEAKVTIGFVQPAERDHDGALTFTLPSVLNPRYLPHHMIGDPAKMKEQFLSKVPYVAVSEVSYSMNFDAKVCLGVNSMIAEIKVANETKDTINVSFENDEKTIASVTLNGNFVQDHDFSLRIMPAEPFKPMVFVEPGCQSKEGWLSRDIACAWFEPGSTAGKPLGTEVQGDEFWFVVDRSGSMGGSKIENAKTALVLFVKSLPVSCKFNIVGFGSRFSALFTEGVVNYTDITVEKALDQATAMKADMGGTEILEPLKFIYSQPKPTQTGARQFIVLLTDGEVGNIEEVIDLARKNAVTSRVFTVGIGEGASSALVNGLARVSGGLSEFVRNSQDRLQAKVISLLKAATNPGAEKVSLKWEISAGRLASKTPDQLPTAVYQGHPLLQYALLERHHGNLNGYARLTASIEDIPFEQTLPFNVPLSDFSSLNNSMPLHRLAAKARLQELADESAASWNFDKFKNEMVAISVATGVLCNETALVAVDLETKQLGKDKNGRPLFVSIERPTQYMRMYSKSAASCGAPMNCSGGGGGSDVMMKSSIEPIRLQSSRVNSSKREIANAMELLVRRQKLNGSWLFSDDLAQASGSKKATNEAKLRQLISTVGQLSGIDDAIKATLIGLAILRRRFATRRDEWELIEQKALTFLQPMEGGKVDELANEIATALAI